MPRHESRASSAPARSKEAIASLALLKVQWDRHHTNYVDNFLPFVRYAIAHSTDAVITTGDLQAGIETHFGLRLPQQALRLLLDHAARRHWVRVDHRIFVRNDTAGGDPDFDRQRRQVEEDHHALVEDLRRFAGEFGHQWSEEQASTALLTVVTHGRDEFLARSSKHLILPPRQTRRDDAYVAGQFVKSALETSSQNGTRLDRLFRGLLLAHALYLPDASQADRRFRNTRIFFDTPFLMEALGCRGQPLASLRHELLNLLYETGADLRCFRATVEECRRALMACVNAMRNPTVRTHGPTAATVRHFTSSGYSPSDIELVVASIERRLLDLRVAIEDAPSYADHEFIIDEKGLAAALERNLAVPRPAAVAHDVDAVAAIMRLRGRHRSRFAEDCRALFVTTNRDLARVARAFLRREHPEGYLPPCVTDFTLTNLLWLKAPTAAPKLPLLQLIADSYALVQPSDALWDQYVDEVTRLQASGSITRSDYFLLRYQIGAKDALMGATHAGSEAVSEGTIQTVLADIQEAIADEERRRGVELQQAIAAKALAETVRRQMIRARCDRIARSGAIALALLVPLVVFVLLAIFAPFHIWAALLLGILGAVALATGWSSWGLGRRLEALLGRHIYRFYCHIAFLVVE